MIIVIIISGVVIKFLTDLLVYYRLFEAMYIQKQIMIAAGINGLSKMRCAIFTLSMMNIMESLMVMTYRVSYDLNHDIELIINTLALKLVDPFVKLITFFGFVTIFVMTSQTVRKMTKEERARTIYRQSKEKSGDLVLSTTGSMQVKGEVRRTR